MPNRYQWSAMFQRRHRIVENMRRRILTPEEAREAPPEEPTSVERLQEVSFHRNTGFPFVMVFAYPPQGQLLYTGDLASIKSALSEHPTHHGFVVSYRGGELAGKPSGHCINLFGKHSYRFQSRTYLTLDFVDSRDRIRGQFYEGRSKFMLILNRYGEGPVVLHKWRRLPKCYLQQFKDADRILDEHDQ